MDRAMTWHIEIFLSEEGVRTRAGGFCAPVRGPNSAMRALPRAIPTTRTFLKSVRNWQVHAHLVVSRTTSLSDRQRHRAERAPAGATTAI